MIEVFMLGFVFLLGLGGVAAAIIFIGMRLLKGKAPQDSTPPL
jgi:hypothetical protein